MNIYLVYSNPISFSKINTPYFFILADIIFESSKNTISYKPSPVDFLSEHWLFRPLFDELE